MAGRGPAPQTERISRKAPARGEWTDIPSQNPARTPKLPAAPRGGWSEPSKRAWKAWWSDPASLMWDPADVDAVTLLLDLHHSYYTLDGDRGKASLAAEIRQRSDLLGLTQKGKRDHRWRVVRDEVAEKRVGPKTASPYAHLKVVSDAVGGPD